MKLRTRVFMQLAALFFVAASSFAAENAYLYVSNAIPGKAVASNLSPGYPIDILISGTCVRRSLAFGEFSDPLGFVPGTYDVQISEANAVDPCSNPAVASLNVTLSGGTSLTAVAEISGGSPALMLLSDDLSKVAAGSARFIFGQTADAGTLTATLTQVGVSDPKTYSVSSKAGQQQAIKVLAGTYLVQIFNSGASTVLASKDIVFDNQSAVFVYAAGQATTNSIGLVYKVVDGLY
jgi:hypothetical protein